MKKTTKAMGFLRKYAPEIIAALVALIGVFLLVEQFQIRRVLITALFAFLNFLKSIAASFKSLLVGTVTGLTLSDAIGWLLIFLTMIFFISRVRYRFLHSESMRASHYPKCGSPLHVVHRRWYDRLITAIFLPRAHRYRCKNHECDWSGLRRGRERSRLAVTPDQTLDG